MEGQAFYPIDKSRSNAACRVMLTAQLTPHKTFRAGMDRGFCLAVCVTVNSD